MRSSYLLLVLSVGMGAAGQLLLKLAVNSLGGGAFGRKSLVALGVDLLTNGYFLAGVALFGGSMLLWLFVIAKTELSRAYPSVSLSYVIVFAASVFLFGETVTVPKVLGIVAIMAGVVLVNL